MALMNFEGIYKQKLLEAKFREVSNDIKLLTKNLAQLYVKFYQNPTRRPKYGYRVGVYRLRRIETRWEVGLARRVDSRRRYYERPSLLPSPD
jgi:hypothetical protein